MKRDRTQAYGRLSQIASDATYTIPLNTDGLTEISKDVLVVVDDEENPFFVEQWVLVLREIETQAKLSRDAE